MDLRLLEAAASDAERAAVDAVLGPPESGWDGGAFDEHSGRIARTGHALRARRHLLLPALHGLRDRVGWITEGGLAYVSERLMIPPAEAFGVATFYALLGTEPRSERVVHLCNDVMCSRSTLERRSELEANGVTVVSSPCLGGCASPPAELIDDAGSNLVASSATPAAPQDREGLTLLHRVGVVDPSSLDDYRAHGGLAALERVREVGPEAALAEIEASNLRGRGGAAFPTALKWRGVREAPGSVKHVIANGDESEPGTFKDRVLMEADPHAVIEGLIIAAEVTGATNAWVYVRAEYPEAVARLRRAAANFTGAGLAGDVSIEIRVGAGAYVCGEETALFASIEGQRGEPRQKPPFPTTHGLFGQPTSINNIETLACVVDVIARGSTAFTADGSEQSSGRKLFSVSGDVGHPGVYEVPFGTTLGDLLTLAGGAVGGLGAILLGGAAGVFVRRDHLDMPLTLEDTAAAGATLGSGAVMVFAEGTDFGAIVRRIAAFFRDESCGKCVPCRIGTVRQEEALQRLGCGAAIGSTADELALLADLDAVMTDASICGLGRTASSAVRSALALQLPGVIA